MKKKYEKPQLFTEEFETRDVIVTSNYHWNGKDPVKEEYDAWRQTLCYDDPSNTVGMGCLF